MTHTRDITGKRNNKHKTLRTRLFWIGVLLALWELSVKIFNMDPMLFPSVEEVALTLYEDTLNGSLLIQLGHSLLIITFSLFLSALLALLLALPAEKNKAAEGFTDTLTALMHPLPGLALLPLIVMWFGVGDGAVMAVIIHSALWPILVNIRSGFKNVPEIYIETARSFSMPWWKITLEVRLPSSLPSLLSGIKIAWSRSWRTLISAEMVFGAVGAYGGIGRYILSKRTFMDTSGLFAGIILVIAVGLIVEDAFFGFIEKKHA